uniref:CRISPR system Cms protein Csm5 n=1 Tax=candidate division WOR-3 bacterium TaxID=2052148 RepID=A0A7C4U7Q5_UNCW3
MGVKNYILHCFILSPIHIGDGSEIEPLNYVIKNGKLYKIRLEEFIYSLDNDKKNIILNLMKENNLKGIRKFIKDNIDLQKFREYIVDVSRNVQSLYEEKFEDLNNQLILIPFIRSSNIPYIPGSSLKGAIRTAVLNELDKPEYKDEEISERNKSKNVEGIILNTFDINRKGEKFYKPDKDPFRFIKVKDVFLPENSTIFEKIDTIYIKNRKSLGIQQIFEVIKTGINFDLEIGIDEKGMEKSRVIKLDIKEILNHCDKFYNNVLDEESKKFSGSIQTKYLEIKEKSKNGYLIRLGRGCGYDSITLKNWKFKKELKTKMLLQDERPLGFLLVKEVKEI